jgi:hypothetical protein
MYTNPRRRFQFSLRTLLIGVTLLAVACWVIVDRQRLIRERDDAVLKQRQLEAMNADLQEAAYRFNDLKQKLEAARAEATSSK